MNISAKTERTVREYICRMVLRSEPLSPEWNCENRIFRKQPKWNYIDSCMIHAAMMYRDEIPGITEYAVRFMNSYVYENGDIPTLRYSDFNLDNICGGRELLSLYRITGDERYIRAAEGLFEGQLKNQPRLDCGSFWHKGIYPYQVWLDGVYMALPFMTEYGIFTGDNSCAADALSQTENIRRIMRDETTGLYYHGYCEKKNILWADRDTGLSANFWLRSNGWLCAGLADLYELTEDKACGEMLDELLKALTAFADGRGMLMQLPALPEQAGNYVETSGTLLYAYSAMKASRMGVSGSSVYSAGRKALEAVTENYITHDGEVPVLSNICLMGGLGGDSSRDGSAGYYLSERVVENDAKGIAPYLMAAHEYLINS